MPIDSLQKRASIAYLVLPDATIDAGDRQTLAKLYSGILAGAPIVVVIEPRFSILGAADDLTVVIVGLSYAADGDTVLVEERRSGGYRVFFTGNSQERRRLIGPRETERRRIKTYG